jgi:WD40 repeat protein
MAMLFVCRCGKKLRLNNAPPGKKFMCPACKEWSIVPDPGQAASPLPAQGPAEAMPITLNEDAKTRPPDGKAQPIEEDEWAGGSYGLKEEEARPGADALSFVGELGCFKLSREKEAIPCVTYAPDDHYALAGMEESVCVLDVKEGKKAAKFRKHSRPVTALAFSPDGRFALSGDEGAGIALWEVAGTRFIKWLDGHREGITCVAFTPDGRQALSAAGDGLLLLWDLKRGEEIACLKEGTKPVHCIAFSPDGRRFLSAGAGGSVRLWDVEKARPICSLPEASGTLTTATFAADGATAFAARPCKSSHGGVAAWSWDLQTREPEVCYESSSKNLAEITCVALSRNGDRLLSAGFIRPIKERSRHPTDLGDVALFGGAATGVVELAYMVRDTYFNLRNVIQVWKPEADDIVQTLEGHQGPIGSLAVSHGGRRCLSGAGDGTVRAWSVS